MRVPGYIYRLQVTAAGVLRHDGHRSRIPQTSPQTPTVSLATARVPRRFGLTLSPQLAERIGSCGATFVVVGARGWLGRASLDILDWALGQFSQRVRQRRPPLRPNPVDPCNWLRSAKTGVMIRIRTIFLQTRPREGAGQGRASPPADRQGRSCNELKRRCPTGMSTVGKLKRTGRCDAGHGCLRSRSLYPPAAQRGLFRRTTTIATDTTTRASGRCRGTPALALPRPWPRRTYRVQLRSWSTRPLHSK